MDETVRSPVQDAVVDGFDPEGHVCAYVALDSLRARHGAATVYPTAHDRARTHRGDPPGIDAGELPASGARHIHLHPGDALFVPPVETCTDQPHIVHRSRRGPDGTRIPDTHTDQEMHTAGAEDAARHVALTHGQMSALAPTVIARPTQHPPAAVDGFWLSTILLPALHQVDVIDMSGLSDHHAVRIRLHRATLAHILRRAAAPHRDREHTPDTTLSAAR